MVDCPTRLDLRSRLLDALDTAAGDLGSHSSKGSTVAVRDRCESIGGRRQRLRRNLRLLITQNCLGLKTATRLTELIAVLRQRGAFAAFLQETWRTGTEVHSEEGWTFIGSAPPSQHGRGSKGAGIALSPLATAALDETHNDLGPRVVAARLLGKEPNRRGGVETAVGIFLISAYAPVSTADDASWDVYYSTITSAMARAHHDDVIIIGTDGNASVGRGSLDGETAEDWVRRVDAALYDAKQGGRNRVVVSENRELVVI